MNKKNVEYMPSETALFAALHRAIAHKQYNNTKLGPDYLAEIFLPAHYRFFLRFDKVRENTRIKLAQAMPGMTEYIIARTAYFDRLFQDGLKDQIPQVVLLGAGYDSRAYRFAQSNKCTKIFELDAFPTQNRKIKCLKAAHIRLPEEVLYIPINFTSESLGIVLEQAGYKNQERTLFLWEGVSMYLDREAVKNTLRFISCSHTGSVIAYDYTISISEENLNDYFGAKEFLISMMKHHANEEMLFSIKHGEINSFLADMNLRMIDNLGNEAIEGKYLLDENGSSIGRMTGNFRFVCASPITAE